VKVKIGLVPLGEVPLMHFRQARRSGERKMALSEFSVSSYLNLPNLVVPENISSVPNILRNVQKGYLACCGTQPQRGVFAFEADVLTKWSTSIMGDHRALCRLNAL